MSKLPYRVLWIKSNGDTVDDDCTMSGGQMSCQRWGERFIGPALVNGRGIMWSVGEEDWQSHQSAVAAITRLEAELEQVKAERDSLRLELAASEHARIKDNEYLLAERDRLRAALEQAIEWVGLDGDGISEPTLSELKAALSSPSPTPQEPGR